MESATDHRSALEEAEDCLLQRDPSRAARLISPILAADPGHAQALHIAGMAAAMRNDSALAVTLLRQAARLGSSAVWHADLAAALYLNGQFTEAVGVCRDVLANDCTNATAHDLLARIFGREGKEYAARDHLRSLMDLRRGDWAIVRRLARAEFAAGNVPEAIGLLRTCIDAGTAGKDAHSDYVSALLFDPEQTSASLRAAFEDWGRRFGHPAKPRSRFASRARKKEKLRIGYFGGEFGATPSRFFVLPIIQQHDRSQFEITCYHTRRREDSHTAAYREAADLWRDCSGLADEAIAKQIEDDGIDILTDVSGHFRHHRLSVFSLQPAPVQVSYPNHPATTGLDTVQYVLTDRWVCPPGTEQQYTERTWRLESGYFAYAPPAAAPAPRKRPASTTRKPVFGIFQWPAKWNDKFWDAVGKILQACPEATLVVHYSSSELDDPESEARRSVARELSKRGIAPGRLTCRGLVPRDRYFDLFEDVEIALDTFPYNGVTTTCECLWMGIPVVTLVGATHQARIGYELLDRAGLGEFAATDATGYVEIAVSLARDPARLSALRSGLRRRIQRTPLLSTELLTREIERAYQDIWDEFIKEFA